MSPPPNSALCVCYIIVLQLHKQYRQPVSVIIINIIIRHPPTHSLTSNRLATKYGQWNNRYSSSRTESRDSPHNNAWKMMHNVQC